MKSYLIKWAIASLVMPLIVIALSFLKFVGSLQFIVLAFWPGSLFLISLGGPEPRPIIDVIYVWTISVLSNVVLYLVLGALFYLITKNINNKNAVKKM
jgi:hypothetical protein